ncbi:hypothetical protein FHG87_005971 [Trinorchestia longiramus]|nr:hypothetical protein FHG87_005971 [Trinorchestia longiramus]
MTKPQREPARIRLFDKHQTIPVLPIPVLPIPVLPIPVLPIPVLPIPVLPIPVLPIPVLPIPVLPIPVLPILVLAIIVPSYPVRSYHVNFSRPTNPWPPGLLQAPPSHVNQSPPNAIDDRLDHRNGNPPSNNPSQNNGGNAGINGANNNGGGGNGGVLGDLSLGQHMAPAASLYARSNGSAASTSPPTVSTPSMLIVPQPINAAKMPSTPPGLVHNQANGGTSVRKYQCKMCPQVSPTIFL